MVIALDRELRSALTGILASEQYDLKEAAGLDAAVRTLAAWSPDVLVVDSAIASRIDESLVEHFRSLRIPTVVIASRPEDGPRTARLLGADAFFNAPVFVPDLIQTLERLSSGKIDDRKFLVLHGDRRGPTRPKHGDIRPCLRCGGAMRFKEAGAAPPAWVCGNASCSTEVLIRVQRP